MSLVTGIGDEVITVMVTFSVMLIVTLVWRSTMVRDRPTISIVTLQPSDLNEAIQAPTPDASADSGGGGGLDPEHSQEVPHEEEYDDNLCVTIRLRFIDETQFEVRTPLTVTLGQFRAKHLRPRESSPFGPNDRVRLIFNGKVLHTDTSTLTQLGLQDNCTVHCLIQRDPGPNGGHGNHSPRDLVGGPDLDLSNLFFPILGTVLFVIWWCQVVYSHYFSFTSSLSLISLTMLYVASITNAYLNH